MSATVALRTPVATPRATTDTISEAPWFRWTLVGAALAFLVLFLFLPLAAVFTEALRKGVGVFFITQLPDDVPDEILAQLGNRIQHALRAFTPRDAKALKAAVTTYPKTADYDLEADLTRLGIGEAMITTLDDNGTPTPVVWTKLSPPSSKMGAVDGPGIDAAAKALTIWSKYAGEVDRQSAREMLDARVAVASAASVPAPTAPTGAAPADTASDETGRSTRLRPRPPQHPTVRSSATSKAGKAAR